MKSYNKNLTISFFVSSLLSYSAASSNIEIPGLDEIIALDNTPAKQAQSLEDALKNKNATQTNVPSTIQSLSSVNTNNVQTHEPQILPMDKITLPKTRPQNLKTQNLQQLLQENLDQSTEKELLTIIADSEINKILEKLEYTETSQHKLVWLEGTSIPLAPLRPQKFGDQTGTSQPAYVNIPSIALEGLVLSGQPNMAMRGKNMDRIKIFTPPPRPNNLVANLKTKSSPDVSDIPAVASNIQIDRSTGGLKIRYTKIRFKKSGSCSIRNARNVTGVGNVSLLPAAIMNKDFSIKIAQFEKNVLQPAARKYYGSPATQIKHLSSFRCSNIAGTRSLSQHAKANALDVSSFVFADGRSVSLTKGWKGSRRERNFLRELQKGACQIFGTTLTPNYNRAHYNHFHFDAKKRKSRAICK